jgi:hypothetical protein
VLRLVFETASSSTNLGNRKARNKRAKPHKSMMQNQCQSVKLPTPVDRSYHPQTIENKAYFLLATRAKFLFCASGG